MIYRFYPHFYNFFTSLFYHPCLVPSAPALPSPPSRAPVTLSIAACFSSPSYKYTFFFCYSISKSIVRNRKQNQFSHALILSFICLIPQRSTVVRRIEHKQNLVFVIREKKKIQTWRKGWHDLGIGGGGGEQEAKHRNSIQPLLQLKFLINPTMAPQKPKKKSIENQLKKNKKL